MVYNAGDTGKEYVRAVLEFRDRLAPVTDFEAMNSTASAADLTDLRTMTTALYGLDLDRDLTPVGTRSNFARGADGKVAWFRNHGRLYQRL